jgi:uncharacterized protein YbjQ (UPF0145 family)
LNLKIQKRIIHNGAASAHRGKIPAGLNITAAAAVVELEEATLLILTTHNIEGKKITKYLGLVSGEAILGANIFKDFFAGIRDIVGGRSAAYEQELKKAKDIAIAEMSDQAKVLGGNAVIGVDLDYETIQVGQSGGMLMVSANGTAVFAE